MTNDKLTELALRCGATKAAVIDVKQIVFSVLFRDICASNGCGEYGMCWMCPPDVGEIEDLMAKVQSYPKAILFQTITKPEDSFDIEGMGNAGKELTDLCLRLRNALEDQLGSDMFILGAGGCRICRRCAKRDALPCRRPEDALLSLEACGIDVYNTVKDTKLKYINGQNTVTFFGMILYN